MPLIILEGPRNSGKTHLFNKIDYPKFKFDFTGVYGGLGLSPHSDRTHSLGLGKEIMLHQLYQRGIIGDTLIIDRGILTNQVWGIYQNRVFYDDVYSEIDYLVETGLFENVHIIVIKSDLIRESRKNKDHWDHLDCREERDMEDSIFNDLSQYMQKRGISVHYFVNIFDVQSEESFKKLIENIVCAEF
jgi:hypothetical protein